MAGLYIHIPFCKSKCRYCDFVSFADTSCVGEYIKALKHEITRFGAVLSGKKFNTVFFGGGTPSILPQGNVSDLMATLKKSFNISEDAEISIEVNPGTLSMDKLKEYKSAGINRLSMGLQSTDNALLARLGRIHTYEEFLDNYNKARSAGFTNINADIMYGIAEQTIKQHLDSVNALATLGVDHVSAYSLIVEENTPLYTDVIGGVESLPSEDDAFEMHTQGMALLESLGYKRYEISNYAKPGCESRHNLNYWANGEYLGLGTAAHSALKIDSTLHRFSNIASVEGYIAAINTGGFALANAAEQISKKDEMFETVMLGLRTLFGIDEQSFSTRFNEQFSKVFERPIELLVNKGWAKLENNRFYLTNTGLDMQNEALMEFMD